MLQKQGMMPSIVAYHGTPHNIEGAFDISKVGTGEGAQAYGHGMYYAENPKVADQYRKDLSADINYNYDTKKYQVIDKRKKILGEFDDLRTANEEAIKAGNLYKVDIPDEYVPNMIDWDKQLKDQPEFIKKFVSKHEKELTADMHEWMPQSKNDKIWDRMRGIDLMFWANELYGKEKAAKYLDSQGIKGIKYLDEQSRSKKAGTSNFVVFEPSKVKIVEKNPINRKEILKKELENLK
jgi:hypothetical protein